MRGRASCTRRAFILKNSRSLSLYWTRISSSITRMRSRIRLIFILIIALEDKNFNLIMLSNAQIHILENFGKQFKYVFQIENENRKYILSTKSQYDLEQWVFAI